MVVTVFRRPYYVLLDSSEGMSYSVILIDNSIWVLLKM